MAQDLDTSKADKKSEREIFFDLYLQIVFVGFITMEIFVFLILKVLELAIIENWWTMTFLILLSSVVMPLAFYPRKPT